MWAQYAAGAQSVAITTTSERLQSCLEPSSDRLFLGEVEYLDWKVEKVNNDVAFPISKRKNFAHEREVRIMYWDLVSQNVINNAVGEALSPGSSDEEWKCAQKRLIGLPYMRDGKYVSTKPADVVEDVYVSPLSPAWFRDAVQACCVAFGLERDVTLSELISPPLG